MLWDGIARRSAGSGGGGGVADIKPPIEREPRSKVRIGLALGGGAARGWSHIGVLRVLNEAGIVPDVIAGCSIGAVVGGCYAAGKLDELEAFALSLTKRRVMGLLDFHFSGAGLIAGGRLQRLLDQDLTDKRVENLPVRFCTIATELVSGHEIWLTRGPLVQAMRASYALPGVFDPVMIGGRWLMDGALVNPIPITAARALGADIVICVNLNGEVRVRGTVIQSYDTEDSDEQEIEQAIGDAPRRWGIFPGSRGDKPRKPNAPGMATVMVDAFNITQDRIARSRLAGDPPDIMVAPKLAKMGLFEFHRAQECIALGKQATERALPDLLELLQESQAR
ncbi:patatin-like phospholipase family protein [Microvirga aerilata]|jgi:NTE family protein|uniref:Patatin-like phospholipase family protein n=1 Tax=Microvirga aerilata TaxID=670292 RepID=A0A936ZA67_9HYPH|nr:patatin-like phospholipase family protein [Microvirga aerilata]MBL0402987.1 patatin-like phospholipase family protein [Microvirga aerilata]